MSVFGFTKVESFNELANFGVDDDGLKLLVLGHAKTKFLEDFSDVVVYNNSFFFGDKLLGLLLWHLRFNSFSLDDFFVME